MLTWHASNDAHTCPICKDLDGYTWTFEAGKDTFPSYLQHPQHGLVWYVWGGSHAHGHERFNCRCSISTSFDLEDILAKATFLYEELKFGTETV